MLISKAEKKPNTYLHQKLRGLRNAFDKLFLKSSAQYLHGKKLANSSIKLIIDFISCLVGVIGQQAAMVCKRAHVARPRLVLSRGQSKHIYNHRIKLVHTIKKSLRVRKSHLLQNVKIRQINLQVHKIVISTYSLDQGKRATPSEIPVLFSCKWINLHKHDKKMVTEDYTSSFPPLHVSFDHPLRFPT